MMPQLRHNVAAITVYIQRIKAGEIPNMKITQTTYFDTHREHRLPSSAPVEGRMRAYDVDSLDLPDSRDWYFTAHIGEQCYRCAIWIMNGRQEYSAYGPREVFEYLGLLPR